MAILLLTDGASWQEIADLIVHLGDRCKKDPHYFWVEKPRASALAVELEKLLRYLGLEEQWAYIDDVNQSAYGRAIVFEASKSGRSTTNVG